MIGIVIGILLFVFVGLPLIVFMISVGAAMFVGKKLVDDVKETCKFYPFIYTQTSDGFTCKCPGQESLFEGCRVAAPSSCSGKYLDPVTEKCLDGNLIPNNPLPLLQLRASVLTEMEASPYHTVATIVYPRAYVDESGVHVPVPDLVFINPNDAFTRQGMYWSVYFNKVAVSWAADASKVLTARNQNPSQEMAWKKEQCQKQGVCNQTDSLYNLDRVHVVLNNSSAAASKTFAAPSSSSSSAAASSSVAAAAAAAAASSSSSTATTSAAKENASKNYRLQSRY